MRVKDALATSVGAKVPVEMLTNSLSFGSKWFVQKLQNGLNVSFIPSDSRYVQVWVTDVTHSTSNHFSEVPQIHTTVLRSEVIPLHIIPIQAKAVCASCCLCISVDCFLDGLIHSGTAEGILVTKLDTETTLHELFVHLWVVNGRRNIVA